MPETLDLERFVPPPPPPPPDPRAVIGGGMSLLETLVEAPKRVIDAAVATVIQGGDKVLESVKGLKPPMPPGA